jgi:glycine cleavage system H protein
MTHENIVPEGYRYTKDHEWVKRDDNLDNVVIIGITDHAQQALGDVVHVEFPSVGDEVAIDDELGVVESAKSASEIYVPINGKIVKVNEDLDTHPEYINESPYDKGWIVKIEISDPDDLDLLLSTEGYKSFLEDEE